MKFLAQLFFRILLLPWVRLAYRVRRVGVGNVPREGGVLLLGNHVSYVDSFIVYLSCPRPVRFVVLENYLEVPAIGWFLKLFGAIPIRKSRAKEAITRTVEALKEGSVVCLFPEGGLTRLGVTTEFRKGFELIVRRSQCPVVPFYMDGLWRSIFSFERDRYFNKRPHGLTCPLQVAFGRPVAPDDATVDSIRAAVWDASVEAFAARRDFDMPLEEALIRGLKRKRRNPFLVEYTKTETRVWSRAYTLGLATAMARRWLNQPGTTGDRIGILLPPGPMTVVINYGLVLAGKVPVNLPFTIDQHETEAVAKAIAPLGIKTVITSQAFMSHLMDFWHGDEGVFIDLKSVVSSAGAGVVAFERIRAYLEPTWLTAWRLSLGERSREREACGLMKNPGDTPVLLQSDELHRNALQVTSASFVRPDDVIFSEEPLSSPAGMMLGCWSPAVSSGRVVCRSFAQRAESGALEIALVDQGATVVVGSAQFFSQINHPLSIRSLKYGILFGPANQWQLEDWEESLDLPLARAWEHSGRIVTMSRTDPTDANTPHHAHQNGRHPKSVGRFLPGIGAKVENDRLYLRFKPLGGDSPPGEWVEGPSPVELDGDGFLSLRGADLAAEETS